MDPIGFGLGNVPAPTFLHMITLREVLFCLIPHMLCMLWVYYHTAKNFGNKTLAALGLEASNRYVGSVPVPFSAQYPSAVAVAVVIPAVTVTIAATTVTAVLVAAPNINTAAVVAAAVIAFVGVAVIMPLSPSSPLPLSPPPQPPLLLPQLPSPH